MMFLRKLQPYAKRMASLEVNICGLKFANPVMPAAGPPVKDAKAMIDCIEVGECGGVVAKTVSLEAAIVPRPCMIKISKGNESMLNHELWSDMPYEQWTEVEYKTVIEKHPEIPFIASAGYDETDISTLSPILVESGAQALELSIHYLGDDPSFMQKAIEAAKENTDVPIFPKLSPNIPDIQLFAKKAVEAGADGIVAINSVGPCLKIDTNTGHPVTGGQNGYGWLSGEAIKPMALRCVYEICSVVDVPVIGVGGISTGLDAVEFIMAGASAVQVCTAAIFDGPKAFKKVIDGIRTFMEEKGYNTIEDFKGISQSLSLEREEKYLDVVVPKLNEALCTQCGTCSKHCIYDAIDWEKKQYPSFNDLKCYSCGLCTSYCPTNALEIRYWE